MIGTRNLIRARVRHVDYDNKIALVLNRQGKSYAVNLSDKVIYNKIHEKDLAFIKIINGTWIVVDFEPERIEFESDKYDAQLIGGY